MVTIVDNIENCTHVVVDDEVPGWRVRHWITDTGASGTGWRVVRASWIDVYEAARALVCEEGHRCPLDEPRNAASSGDKRTLPHGYPSEATS